MGTQGPPIILGIPKGQEPIAAPIVTYQQNHMHVLSEREFLVSFYDPLSQPLH